MRLKIFFQVVLFLIPLCTFGQSVRPGLKAGMGGAFFKNTDIKNEYSFAYLIGAYANYAVNKDKSISIQTEVLFTKKGGASYVVLSDVKPYPIPDQKLNYDLYYIEVPILVKFCTRGELSRGYFMTGISPALFLKGRSRFDIFNGSEIMNENSLDIGWIGSIGIEYNISRVQLLFLEARVNNGLRDVFHDTNIRNFTYALLSGIRF